MDVDVDENDAMSRRSSQTDENDTSSFRALLKDIKNLEKQSKAREQQLVSKLEQQREQWEREKEQLLEQLRQKEPSVKASHSPARTVLGAVTPNKQTKTPSKYSQTTSELSYQDVFGSPASKDPSTSVPADTTPLPPFRIPPSPSQLSAQLQAARKELKRVKQKYAALYGAQEEILRRRNRERDKWRQFKQVVGTVCKANPEFQYQLRQADRLLKEQQIVSVEMAEEVHGPRRSRTPEQNESRDRQHTSPLKPSLAIPKATGLDTQHASDAFGSSLACEDTLASSFIMNASGSNGTNLQENPAPSIDERCPPSLTSERDMMLSPQARQHLDWLTDAAFFDLEQEARAEQAAVDAAEALEEEANRQLLHRIYREYAPPFRHPYENGGPSNKAVWRLDGVQLDGPALPPSSPQEGVSRLHDLPNQNTPSTQMSIGHKLAFWAEGPHQAPSQASIPSDIEFGNYVPATAHSCLAGATSEMKDSVNDESQEKRLGALHPNPYQTEATASRSDFSFGTSPRNGSLHIYPLPQELQSRLSPNQEILEETIPMRRTKVCRPSILSKMPLLLEREAPENIVGNSGMVEDEERSDTAVTITTMPPTNEPSPSHEDEADNEAAEASSRGNSQQSGATADKVARGSQEKQLVAESRTSRRSLSGHLYDAVSPVIMSPFFQKAAPPAVHNESQNSEVGSKTKSKMQEGMHINNTLDPKIEHEAAAQEAMHKHPAMSLLKLPNARLSSYRPSKLSSEPLSSVRAVSNETIGPAKVGLIKSATARSQASSSLPVEDLWQTFYTTFIERSQTEKPSTNTLPIGKVIPQIHLAAIDPSPGNPSGWVNLSTKKRLSSQLRTASPAPSAGVAMYKQMKHAPKASDTFSTAISSGPSTAKKETLVGDGHAQRQGSMPAANVARSAASDSNKCNATSATETPSRPPSGEQANEVKRSKVKKPKRNAPVPDADVQRDLDLIEEAIIRKNAANSNMGKKRPATSSDLEQKRVMKKPRKSNGRARGAVSEDEIDVKPTKKELENASGECHRGTRVGGRNKEKTRPIHDDRNLDKVPSRDRKSRKSSTNENVQSEGTPQVKSEDAEEITEDKNEAPQSSEEHPGQNFLREIHRKRKFAMLSKENKFTADSSTTSNATTGTRSKVAYKESVRGREARKAMHGEDCVCCRGYYEYATRNLPVEERAQAAADMANDVSRHRQNWETNASPPGYWQMGFPDTQQVEQLNAEAQEALKEKAEKEEKRRIRQCGGRFEYKVV